MITALKTFAVGALTAAILQGGSIGAASAVVSSPDYQGIDSYVASSLAGTPGSALAIVHGDRAVHLKGFGMAGSNEAAVTPDTPFVIGSEAKSVTALAVMQLSEAGKLDLNAPVRRYLPWFHVGGGAASSSITIRELLNQTSGLPPSAPFDSPVTTVEARVHDLANVQLIGPPGHQYAYSNSNYETLGLVVAVASGETYGDYVDQHIFQPLGMTHSFTSEGPATEQGLATGHQWWFGVPSAIDTFRSDYVPAGYLISSVSDMGHFLIAQLNGGVYKGNRVLSAVDIDQMHLGVAQVATGGRYGMGWVEDTLNGIDTVSHDGDSLNMHSDMVLVPSLGWGVELIINSDSLPVLLAASVESTTKGIVSMLEGRAAPYAPSPRLAYAVFDSIVLVLIALQVWSAVRAAASARSERGGTGSVLRHVVLPIAWRLATGLVLLGFVALLAAQLGSSPALIARTDLGVSLVTIAALLVVNGLVRAVPQARRQGRTA